MKESMLNKSAKAGILALGLAGALSLSGCGETRDGNITGDKIVTVSDIEYTSGRIDASQHFGVTGEYELDGRSRDFTSQVIITCREAQSVSPRPDGQALIIGATALTLLGDQIRWDIITDDTYTVGPLGTCANSFHTIDREQVALDYMSKSLNNGNRSWHGDGNIIKDPLNRAEDLLEGAQQGKVLPD